MQDLTGFTTLITGGSSGLGFQMARALLRHGATVVITGRGAGRLETAREKLSAEPGDVHTSTLDVRDETAAAETARWFREHFDHLDMLVNNAGMGDNTPGMEGLGAGHAFYEVPVSAFKTIVDTNFLGFFIVSRAFVPMMVERGRGRLVYVSTSTSTLTRPGQIPYGPSKAASETMSTILADELRESGIDVNVICPGGFADTGMAGAGVKAFFEEHNMPVLPPDVLNKVILFLASPAAVGITGEKIVGKDFDDWLAARGIAFTES